MLKNKLLGVIFDLDNTLVSSSLDFLKIREQLGCPKNVDVLDFVDALPQKQQADAKKLLIEYEMEDAFNASKLIGTDELLALLSRLEIACAIVTRNSYEAALMKVNNNDIDIPVLLTREDHKAKPAPDAILHIAKHWEIPTENLLYVGDYLYDMQAARNANTMSCLVTHGECPDYEHLATVVVQELTELSDLINQTYNTYTSPVYN